jgi:hypothetical protein
VVPPASSVTFALTAGFIMLLRPNADAGGVLTSAAGGVGLAARRARSAPSSRESSASKSASSAGAGARGGVASGGGSGGVGSAVGWSGSSGGAASGAASAGASGGAASGGTWAYEDVAAKSSVAAEHRNILGRN